jgi:hypothetical protein
MDAIELVASAQMIRLIEWGCPYIEPLKLDRAAGII